MISRWQVGLVLLTVYGSVQSLEGITRSDQTVDDVIVTIQDGMVMGKKVKTIGKNTTVYAFQGIPFAEPPLGKLRFEPPVPKRPWSGILECQKDKDMCVQDVNPVTGSEDCLHVSVYTPTLIGNLPVMVYIYGGAFIIGDSNYKTYGPDYILDENVVFVQFNYRLGIFGFLSTEDLVCPGNAGFKDQVLALRWVQKNIGFFGGNRAKVTIFGESSGAAAVGYHMLSPMSRGLFRAAIMDSGTPLSLWSLNRNAKEIAFLAGSILAIPTTDSKVLISEMRRFNYTYLQQVSSSVSTIVTEMNPLEGVYFGPVKEPVHPGAFFTGESDKKLSSGNFTRVPVLLGVNSNEAAAVGFITTLWSLYLTESHPKISALTPADMSDDPDKRFSAGLEIRCFYFDCLSLSSQSDDKIVMYMSDDQFNRPTRRAVMDLSKYVPTYYYVFSYVGSLGGVKERIAPGVGHVEELGYLFRTYYSNSSTNDIITRDRMVKMWTNFVKYRNPTPVKDSLLQNKRWPIAKPSRLNYFNIDVNISIESNPFKDRMDFWDNLYVKYGKGTYDTY
nr:esterase [Phaedon brassicae]